MSRTEARALLIAPATPARSGNGLAMRLGLFHDALARLAPVDTLVLPVSGPPPDEQFAKEFGGEAFTIPVAGRADTQFNLLSRIADADNRLEQFRRYGRGSRHAPLSLPVLADVKRVIDGRQYQLVHAARLYLSEAPAGARTGAVKTLDLDEDDSWAWRRLAETQTRHDAAWSLAEAEAEDRLLKTVGASFDRRFVSGATDQQSLSSRYAGLSFDVVANAIAFPAAPEHRDDGHTLLFVGAFGYQPNVDGIVWFVNKVWPQVRAASPAARLRIVGRSMPEAVLGLSAGEGVEIVGAVDDVAQSYAEATLAIAPLHTGAGTRVKLIEAVAHRVPVVTTATAARGLDFARADAVWIADRPMEFATAVLAALGNTAERYRRATLANKLARATHDRTEVVDRLACQFASMLHATHMDRAGR